MPPLPSDGYLRLPSWVVGLPWLLLVVSLSVGGWMISDLQRQVAEKEEANTALRRQENSNSSTPTSGDRPPRRRRVVLPPAEGEAK